MSNDLTVTQQSVLSLKDALMCQNKVREFMAIAMQEGEDYGVIPGCGDRPTLYQPGAQKLCNLFGLITGNPELEKIEDWNRPFFNYSFKIPIVDSATGTVLCYGYGSCNSKEKKYRYKTVYDNQATPEQKHTGKRIQKRSRAGKPYFVIQIENDDIYTMTNTLLKMAYKRAFVHGVIQATRSAQEFTQDVEDLKDYLEVEYEVVQEPVKPAKTKSQPKPKPVNKPEPVRVQKPVPEPNPEPAEQVQKQKPETESTKTVEQSKAEKDALRALKALYPQYKKETLQKQIEKRGAKQAVEDANNALNNLDDVGRIFHTAETFIKKVIHPNIKKMMVERFGGDAETIISELKDQQMLPEDFEL